MPDQCECGKPVPYDGGKKGVCECCSTCEPAQPKPPSTTPDGTAQPVPSGASHTSGMTRPYQPAAEVVHKARGAQMSRYENRQELADKADCEGGLTDMLFGYGLSVDDVPEDDTELRKPSRNVSRPSLPSSACQHSSPSRVTMMTTEPKCAECADTGLVPVAPEHVYLNASDFEVRSEPCGCAAGVRYGTYREPGQAPVCDCYSGSGFNPATYEGVFEDCPVHGRGKT